MRTQLKATALLTVLAAVGCSQLGDTAGPEMTVGGSDRPSVSAGVDDEHDGDQDETLVSAGDIPQAVRDAASAAAPGLVIDEAELEEGGTIYCVHGTVGGELVEVEVAADGSRAEVESDEDGD